MTNKSSILEIFNICLFEFINDIIGLENDEIINDEIINDKIINL